MYLIKHNFMSLKFKYLLNSFVRKEFTVALMCLDTNARHLTSRGEHAPIFSFKTYPPGADQALAKINKTVIEISICGAAFAKSRCVALSNVLRYVRITPRRSLKFPSNLPLFYQVYS